MAEDKDLALILDFGVALFQSGAETHRVEDSLYRLAAAFGFVRCNIWVIPSNIQATVTAPDGAIMTQIRHIRRGCSKWFPQTLHIVSRPGVILHNFYPSRSRWIWRGRLRYISWK